MIKHDIPNRTKYTNKKDGYVFNTIVSLDRWHEKYIAMSEKEINKINYIG